MRIENLETKRKLLTRRRLLDRTASRGLRKECGAGGIVKISDKKSGNYWEKEKLTGQKGAERPKTVCSALGELWY